MQYILLGKQVFVDGGLAFADGMEVRLRLIWVRICMRFGVYVVYMKEVSSEGR